ncbi:ROK family protein [Erysipelotrichaceae bacterium HCN-30851]
MKYMIGIDIGGTNTRVALINENYEIILREQFSTNIEDPQITLKQIKSLIDNFHVDILGVGVSCPGPLDLIYGKILTPPNLGKKWWNFEIEKEMSNLLGLPVYLENDANLAALAEAIVGKGKAFNYVVFMTISTGIGSGFVINQQIYHGAHGFAHEVTNIPFWRDGPSHGNIYPGGIEAISSGTAITMRAQKAGLLVNHAGEVYQLAINGNVEAIKILDDAKEYLANEIAAVYALLDPEIVVLGGSVAIKIPGFVDEVKQRVKQRCYDNVAEIVNIEKTNLNEDSGLLGAAILALYRHKKNDHINMPS